MCTCQSSAIQFFHLMKLESHWNPSAYPTRFITEHMNTSIGRAPGFFCFESLPYVWWKCRPRYSLSSSSLRDSFLSILFPKITNGTYSSSFMSSKESSSLFASSIRDLSAASMMNMIPSSWPQYSLQVLRAC